MGTRVLVAGGATAARVLVVDKEGNADYTSIQNALDAANGESPSANKPWLILIAPGNYQESITLYDHVHLSGLAPDDLATINPSAGNAIKNGAIMTLANLQLAGDGSSTIFNGINLSGTMTLRHITIQDDDAEVPGLVLNSSTGTFKIFDSDLQAGGPAIRFTQGTAKIYDSILHHYHTTAGAATQGALEITNTGTLTIDRCTIENTSPIGPAIDFKASPTQVKILNSTLRMATSYSAVIDADVAVTPIIAACIGNGDLHANVGDPISYTWDTDI